MKLKLLLTAITSLIGLYSTALADTGYVIIGTGTASSFRYPYGNSARYSTTQSIYTAAEIGTSGIIKTIAYNVATANSRSTTSVQIYMGHTSNSSFSSGPESVANMTLVYSGSPTLATTTGWEELVLTAPFAYNGISNLIIVVGRQSNNYFDNDAEYFYSSTSSTQCLNRSSDSSSSYGNPSSTAYYSTSSSRANVRLGFDAKEVGQFSYIITSETTTAVSGTAATGAVNIPTSVSIDGKNYVVTAVSDCAFQNKPDITSLTIPSSVTIIGSSAFYGCSGLASLTIPSSVTIIGSSAFYGCSGLASLTIPSSVANIGSSAFYGCSGLASLTIPSGMTNIGSYTFYGCSGLTSLTIPSSVMSIGRSAFCNCTGNLIVNCNIGDGSSSDYGWFYGSKFSSVEIGKDVTKIGDYAFYGCSLTGSLTILSSVTSIGRSAFCDCTGKLIVNCNIGDASSSNYGWFYGSKFSSVEICKDVTKIGKYAFYGNNNIQSLIIGIGVTEIGSDAFRNTPIKTIWQTNTPPSGYSQASGKVNYVSNTNFSSLSNKKVYSYLSSMFEDKGIKYVPVNPSERTCDAIDYAYFEVDSTLNIASIVSYRNVSMNVTQIGEYFANNNTSIKELKIGDAITTIGKNAFYGCTSMVNAEIGQGVTAIESEAFRSCSKLQEIAIPDATTSFGAYCFSVCSSLKKADTGDGITAIPSSTFSGCTALETIILGEGIKSIDTYAFLNCSSLADIAIPSNVNKIDVSAFYGCSKLADVIIADRKETITLGNNGLSRTLFSDCPLDSIYIGGKINYSTSSSYGYSPFYRNTSLRTVVITNEETEIYPNEFYGCTGLKNVKIGDGVKKIGDYAFSGCSSLESFGFGEGMQSIGKEAFSDCSSLTRILSEAAVPPTCGSQALEDINKWECTLYVPKANIAAYQAADQWKDFFFVEENVEFTNGIESVIEDTDAKASAVLNLQGQRVSAPAKGEIYILQGKKMLMK